jgi:predicted amidohydrolase
VEFVVGHGSGGCKWHVADAALGKHMANLHGPAFDMATAIREFLLLGVPLERLVERPASAPGRTRGREIQIGALKVGTEADFAA